MELILKKTFVDAIVSQKLKENNSCYLAVTRTRQEEEDDYKMDTDK